jgi:hypothetical protein
VDSMGQVFQVDLEERREAQLERRIADGPL